MATTDQRHDAEQQTGGRGPLAAMARLGAVAVVLALAVVAAQARAGGGGSAVGEQTVQTVQQALGAAILAAGMVILLSGGPRRRKKRRRSDGDGNPFAMPDRRRLVRAAVIGAIAAAAYWFGVRLLPQQQPERSGQGQRPSPQGGGAPEQAGGSGPGPMPDTLGPEDYLKPIVVLAVIAVIVFALIQSRARVVDDEPEQPRSDAEELARAVSAGRQAVAADRNADDPRAAIVACFAAMEDALAGRGENAAPREADTPRELLVRAVEVGLLRTDDAWRLLELFQRARFSRHPIDEADRAEAARALDSAVADLERRR